MSGSFEHLQVWQMGKHIVAEVYQLTKDFRRQESLGSTTQIRRAAISVPANIAEGFGRYHYLDKAKFYLNESQSITDILNMIDKLGLKLNNLVSSTRKLSKESL